MTAEAIKHRPLRKKKQQCNVSIKEPLELKTDADTSRRMALVRRRDTTAELVVRRALAALSQSFRTRNRDLPGSPDIANRKRRWAVFVHGCFWHRHNNCVRTTTPKRNRNFWIAKFQANKTRDRRALHELRMLGYRVVVIWECETEQPKVLAEKLNVLL
jgi:DNA mismatch endonuclease (patch repair protein)